MKLKHESAITLVALIVTIIVLLILAGITITLTVGRNGLLDKVQQASIENEKAEIQEIIQLVIMDIETELLSNQKGGELNKGILVQKLPNKLQGIIIQEDMTGEYRNYHYYIDENYNVHILGKNNSSIQVEQTISYVGTSRCTVKVEANSLEGNIVQYQYMVNNEIKGETLESEYTIEELEPNSQYNISVIAIDEKGNSRKSVPTKIVTKERTYIIKDGILKVEGQTANAQITEEEGYLNLSINATRNRGGYYIIYDLTNYREIKIDAEVLDKGSSCSCYLWIQRSNPISSMYDRATALLGRNSDTNSRERFIESCDIKDFEENYYIFCMKNATETSTRAIIHIYNMWLEE